MSVSRVSRASRSALFAVVCVALAAVGHVLMSGAPLPWWALGLAVAGAGSTGWVFAGRERRGRTVIPLTLAVQACLHVGFTAAQSLARSSPTPDAPVATPREWAGLLLCGTPTPDATAHTYDMAVGSGLTRTVRVSATPGGPSMLGMPGMDGAHHMGGMSGAASWGMVAAHLLAALLCAVWLAQGERAAFQVLRATAHRAFVPLRLMLTAPPVVGEPSPVRHAVTTVRRLRSRLLVHTLTTRGPPGVPAVA